MCFPGSGIPAAERNTVVAISSPHFFQRGERTEAYTTPDPKVEIIAVPWAMSLGLVGVFFLCGPLLCLWS